MKMHTLFKMLLLIIIAIFSTPAISATIQITDFRYKCDYKGKDCKALLYVKVDAVDFYRMHYGSIPLVCQAKIKINNEYGDPVYEEYEHKKIVNIYNWYGFGGAIYEFDASLNEGRVLNIELLECDCRISNY